jgi:peptidoglycan/xylan/chitin deacetylase (PgdA/CDA1 family)
MTREGLVELGAHTHTHQDFRRQPEEFRRDLGQSVEVLRDRFGLEGVTFAFPFGRRHAGFSGDDLMSAARQTGVRCGLTTEARLVDPRSDPFGWGRFNAYEWDTAATLAAKLEGWYGWAPRVQEWLSRFRRG